MSQNLRESPRSSYISAVSTVKILGSYRNYDYSEETGSSNASMDSRNRKSHDPMIVKLSTLIWRQIMIEIPYLQTHDVIKISATASTVLLGNANAFNSAFGEIMTYYQNVPISLFGFGSSVKYPNDN